MKNDDDQYYADLRNLLLNDEQKKIWQEADDNPQGSKTVIIRTDPNQMCKNRNIVKRRYDHRRNWRKK